VRAVGGDPPGEVTGGRVPEVRAVVVPLLDHQALPEPMHLPVVGVPVAHEVDLVAVDAPAGDASVGRVADEPRVAGVPGRHLTRAGAHRTGLTRAGAPRDR